MGGRRGWASVKWIYSAGVLRVAFAIGPVALGVGGVPAFASACDSERRREHVLAAGSDYQRITFSASAVEPADGQYAWVSEWGQIRLERGFRIASGDPALYQIVRYTPVYSTALTRSGYYLQFERASSSNRTITDIRLAAAPELTGGPPIGNSLTEPRPGTGPAIAGYRFQMAERLAAESGAYLGLWRRTGAAGSRTLLVHFTRGRRTGDATRIVGRSDLAFSLISQTDTFHGGDWSFTLFTEGSCPGGIEMLSYSWFLYIPRAVR